MKEILVGTVKACLYMGTLIGVYCVFNGFKTPAQIDIVGVMAVGAILRQTFINLSNNLKVTNK